MTIMTPIEGITAPAIPADSARPALPADTFLPYDETPLLSSRRSDGWSAANQRLFLEAIAEGYGVEQATMRVGLSAASAYAFRRTAKGAAFALGWRAANLVARDAIAETLLVRALEGQVDTVTRADGTVVTRHRHDNRLAMALLARLDRQVEAASDADVKAARLVAQEFDAFLDLVAKDEGPARAGLFLARRCGTLAGPSADGDDADPHHDLAPIYALAAADRFARTGVATAQDVDVSDLDPAGRASWTVDQWQRAEAAGLVALAVPEPAPETAAPQTAPETSPASQLSQHSRLPPPEPEPVWWDEDAEEWRTWFPPPDGFIPDFEEHDPAHHAYERSLTPEEEELMGLGSDFHSDAEVAELAAERDAYFTALGTGAKPAASPENDGPVSPGAAAVDPAPPADGAAR